MAYIKLSPIQSTEYFREAVRYIQRADKTNSGLLVDSYECIPLAAVGQFAYVRNKAVMKKGCNLAWHIKQSFLPSENLTPEQALEIGKEFIRRAFPNFQYIIATHTDKPHLHNHIILNSVDFETFHKLHSNRKSYARLQAISDDICLEHNLSVIDTDGSLQNRRKLRAEANEIINNFFEKNTASDNLETLKTELSEKIKKSANQTNPDLTDVILKNLENGFKKFQSLEQKRRKPQTIADIKNNLEETVFTAIEKSFNGRKKSHKERLKENLNKAIETASDFGEFISLMQEQGYVVKMSNKTLSFKDDSMNMFLRASSISADYTEMMIKYRIESNNKTFERETQPSKNRTVYDNKIIMRSKRKQLQTEIDHSVSMTDTFEDFIADMNRKGYEVKQGKHLAFRNPKTAIECDKQLRFIRSKSIGYDYSEEVLRFRIEHKEEYKNISEAKVKPVMNIGKSDNANLKSWKNAQNVSIRTATTLWVVENILAENYGISVKDYTESKVKFNEAELFGAFLESYKTQKEIIERKAAEVEAVSAEISEILKYKRAVSTYWKLKPTIEKYKAENTDIHSLSGAELKAYKSNTQKWEYALKVMNEAKEKYSLSTSELNSRLDELTARKDELQTDMVRLKLQFENYETVKANYLSKDGYGFLFDTSERFTELAQTAWDFRKKSLPLANKSKAEKETPKEEPKKHISRFYDNTL
ncbi:MAG: relaxase/mobilization nuclease domain-containing protein [Clostridiales bacterium]|nr:relaxase/mobilization nuclease domain-containing protein [Clostridiales bacterium]